MKEAVTRTKENRGTITIKRISSVETVEAVIPAKSGLVKEVLASLPKPRTGRKERSSEQLDYYLEAGMMRYPSAFWAEEGSILRQQRFRKLVNGLQRRHGEWATLTVKIKNTRVIDLTGKKPSASASLDTAEWQGAERTFCDPIVKKNIRAVVIAIRGGIAEEEKRRVFDRLCQQLPPVEAHLISEGSNAAYTRIESMLFGLDVSKENTFREG